MPYFGLLETIAIAANEAVSTQEALQRALNAICEMTGWPMGHAFVRDHDGALRSSGLWHVAPSMSNVRFEAFRQASVEVAFSAQSELPGRAMAERKPVWQAPINENVNFPRYSVALEAGLCALYAFPVLSADEVVAVLEFGALNPQAPDEALLLLMHHVGLQLGHVFVRELNRQQMIANEQRHSRILDAAGDAFIGMDQNGNITAWNAAAQQLFGWTRAEVLGQPVDDLIIAEHYRHAHHLGLQHLLQTGEAPVLGRNLSLPAIHRDGHELFVEITLWALQDVDTEFYAFARDVTERQRIAHELERRAHYDSLTELPNRGLLFKRLTELLATWGDNNLALLFIDLDHFKRINDTLGHQAGDQVLLTVAQRIVGGVRPDDMVARLAGDEFVVLCPGVDDFQQASQVARRITDMLEQPILIGDNSVFVSASIGISIADENSDAETLLTSADTAMYEAKHSGRGHHQPFNQRMTLKAATRLTQERDLREALQHDQLQLHFQPIVNSHSGQVDGVEALLRWHHPSRGVLLPGDFLPVAEASGLITCIDSWVLKEAYRQAATWLKVSGASKVCMAINLSGRQLAQADWIDSVRDVITALPDDAGRIQMVFEIKETVIMNDPEAIAEMLDALKALDIHLTIDDFGSGYSSLACLKRLPVDGLKIGPTFIHDIVHDQRDQAIVRAIVSLADELGIKVVAKEVENEAQAEVLQQLGINHLQGHFLGTPQPGTSFKHGLKEG